MPFLGYTPIKIDKFAGLNTLLDPTNLPIYSSPDTQDTEYLPGLVRTRPGLTSLFAALGGNPTINYLKTYITPTVGDAIRTLVLDSMGILYKEDASLNPGVLTTVSSSIIPASYANSVSIFGREYIAIGDGQYGIDIPRQYDDTNLDRVSCTGPGAAPNPTDEIAPPVTIGATGLGPYPSPFSFSSATEVDNNVTVTVTGTLPAQLKVGDYVHISASTPPDYDGDYQITGIPSASTFSYVCPTSGLADSTGGVAQFSLLEVNTTTAHGLSVGQTFTLAGATNTGYDGIWVVRAVLTTTQFLFAGGADQDFLPSSGNGTVTQSGNIVGGVHQVSVIFVDREGYLTAPAPPISWTASGGKRVVVSNIAIGPPNITQRIIVFTPAGGDNFYYSTGDPSIPSSAMIIADNTTTTQTFDFSDTILLEGTNVDDLFDLITLGECSGVTEYSSRLFWWGERNTVSNFNNLTFDGGIVSGVAVPGWAQDPTFGLNAFLVGGTQAVQGFAWRINAHLGAPGTFGLITQSAYQDSYGVPIIRPQTAYSIRARITQNLGPLTSGVLHIGLYSATLGGIVGTELAVTAAQTPPAAGVTPSAYPEFIGVLTTSSTLTAVPTDLVLRVYADTFSTGAGSFLVDDIEPFPTNNPYNSTLVRASWDEDPESYDGVTGFLQPGIENGQAVRSCFVLRNNFYMVKERSMYVTQDDGVNEPNAWTIQEISLKVGTPSVRGVGIGDEWAVIAAQDGLYYFDGSDPQKISQEIQPTWDAINWAFGYLIDVKVDTKRKRIYISIPYGSTATTNNKVLTLDYVEGWSDSTTTGVGRKWSPWTTSAASVNLILRNDGTLPVWFGNSAANGLIYQLDPTGTVFNDAGAAINSYRQCAFFQAQERIRLGYLTANVVGQGTLDMSLRRSSTWIKNIRGWLLSTSGKNNMERNVDVEGNRISLVFGTNGLNEYFSMQGLTAYAHTGVSGQIRGVNAP